MKGSELEHMAKLKRPKRGRQGDRLHGRLRRELFAREYLVDLNAKAASIRAGYSPRYASTSTLLSDPHVQEIIQRGRQRLLDKTDVTQERVVHELAAIAFSNILDYISIDPLTGDPSLNWSRLTRDQAAAVESITVDEYMDKSGDEPRRVRRVRFKLHNKMDALTDLRRILTPTTPAESLSDLVELVRSVAKEQAADAATIIGDSRRIEDAPDRTQVGPHRLAQASAAEAPDDGSEGTG